MKQDNEGGSLSVMRVIDFTGELGPYAAKLFAGVGADVIHVEPPTGDPLRSIGPFYRNQPGRETSLQFHYYNTGKRSLVLNLEAEEGKEIFIKLCNKSDVFIESCAPGYLDGLGLSFENLSRKNQGLVQTSITPFGHFGPYRGYPGSDLSCSALGGFLYLGGVDNEKSVRAPDNQAYRMAEAYAATGTAIALYNSMVTGKGQHVDVSVLESVCTALENAVQYYDLQGVIRRGKGTEAGIGIYPCQDGHVCIVAIMGQNRYLWDRFVEWLKKEGVEESGLLEDEKWTNPGYRATKEANEIFSRVFDRFALSHTKLYLYEQGQKNNCCISPVSNGKDLLENPQLNSRGFWKKEYVEQLKGYLTFPGEPYELEKLKWRLGGGGPAFGRHTGEILQELGYQPSEIDNLEKEGVIHVG
jgi:benzylsuccinate CoA-transferase BbsE subunit/naphthyl-2-methylsuccinate CoA transferase subunit